MKCKYCDTSLQASIRRCPTCRQLTENDSSSAGIPAPGPDGKYGLLDKWGMWLVKPGFDMVSPMQGGLAPAKRGGVWGLVNEEGEWVVIPRYAYIGPLADGRRAAQRLGKFGYLDTAGQDAIPSTFDMARWFSEGLAAVSCDGSWGYINPSGDVVIPLTYADAGDFAEGLAAVQQEGKYGYIDPGDAFVIAPRFDDAMHFSEGLAAVKLGEVWGFIDATGDFVISPRYRVIYSYFIDEVAEVELDGVKTFVATDGEPLDHQRTWRDELGETLTAGVESKQKVDEKLSLAYEGVRSLHGEETLAECLESAHAYAEEGKFYEAMALSEVAVKTAFESKGVEKTTREVCLEQYIRLVTGQASKLAAESEVLPAGDSQKILLALEASQLLDRAKKYTGFPGSGGERTASKQAASESRCFVATAAYGDADAATVRILRAYRDRELVNSQAGRTFIRFYYIVGPVLAKPIARNEALRRIARMALDRYAKRLDTPR